jgi:hypothetical protein
MRRGTVSRFAGVVNQSVYPSAMAPTSRNNRARLHTIDPPQGPEYMIGTLDLVRLDAHRL